MGVDAVASVGLDRGALAAYAVQAVPGLVFAAVSGAHLYGFPSPDSDVDVRGAFVEPLERYLGLSRFDETLEPKAVVGGLEVEMVAHEMGKYLRLLIKPNGYVLEQILSPLVLVETPAYSELRDLARGTFCKGLVRHYGGFAIGIRKDIAKPEGATVKKLLYAYRVLMTGIVLLREGVLEANVWDLNRRFGLDIDDLVAQKTRELAQFEGDLSVHMNCIERLFSELEAAPAASPLPDEVPNRPAIEDYLVGLRLGAPKARASKVTH